MWEKEHLDSTVFGKIKYINGWQKVDKITLKLWKRDFQIIVCAMAPSKSDRITAEQETAFLKLSESLMALEITIETVMQRQFPCLNPIELIERFAPDEILISRDGSFGICISDSEDEDCEIQPDADLAIALSPKVEFYASQGAYIWSLH